VDAAEVAAGLQEIAALLEMNEESPFRVRAYRRAAESVAGLGDSLPALVAAGKLETVPGVGEGIAGTIREMLEHNGHSALLDELHGAFPDGLAELRAVPGVGPKLAARFYRELGIVTLADMEAAIRDERLARLPRVGQKTAANLLRAIESARHRDDRVPLADALPLAQEIMAALRERCPTLHNLTAAGSLRRFRDTIGDLDLIGTAEQPKEVMDTLVGLPQVREVLAHGLTKTSVLLERKLQLDLRLVPERDFGSLVQHFTGSKLHNIVLREWAVKHGKSISEYGITDVASGEVAHFSDEDDVYRHLGLQPIPPEMREGRDEVEVAARGALPRTIRLTDIRGDLHSHTTWSDGASSLEEMAEAARSRGYSYLAISDHSGGLGVANGLSVERLRAQRQAIHALNAGYERAGVAFRLLAAAEVDIRADGSLDYPDDVLADLDLVVASIHSAMNQPPDRMTARLLRAIENPHVDVIGHLTARLLGSRPSVQYDRAAVFAAAAGARTALEINAHLRRLDLSDNDARYARDLGIMLTIDSDAHHTSGLADMADGVRYARRAWTTPTDVLNTRPLDELLTWLHNRGA